MVTVIDRGAYGYAATSDLSLEGLQADMRRDSLCRPGAFALAHNVSSQNEVLVVMNCLTLAGGHMLRQGDAPPHGGFRGYVADPDDHAWEIAWNPAWAINDQGLVTFGQ